MNFSTPLLILLCVSLFQRVDISLANFMPATIADHPNLTCAPYCTTPDIIDKRFPINDEIFGNVSNRADLPLNVVATSEFKEETSHNSSILIQHLEASSIIFHMTRLANEQFLSRQCSENLKFIERGILQRQPWAMKVLDSSGTKEAGFIWGHNFWLGSSQGCSTLNAPIHRSVTLGAEYKRNMKDGLLSQTAPFDIEYRVVYLEHNSSWQVEIGMLPERTIHLGLCLPISCSFQDIRNLTNAFLEESPMTNLFDLQYEIIHIKDLKLKDSFFENTSLKVMAGCLVFSVVMAVAAYMQRRTELEKLEVSKEHSENSQNFRPSRISEFIKCFDLISNIQSLFAVKDIPPGSIPVINGLRSMTCFWIMMFHSVWYMYFGVNNRLFLLKISEDIKYQYFSSAPLLVDLFFTISGFLQVYNFTRNETRLQTIRDNTIWQNVKEFAKLLFHRYMRLAPPCLAILALSEISTAYSQDVSVFHITDRNDQFCAQNRWRNVLFIQNFFEHTTICANWTWSLSCEMQFFVFVSALLFFYARRPELVRRALYAAFVFNIIWTYVLSIKINYKISFDALYQTATAIYMNPLVRVLPYLTGSIAACHFVQRKQQIHISSSTEKWLWNLSFIIFVGCFFSFVRRDISTLSAASVIVFGRIFLSAAFCWLILGSATGRGSWWSRILESKVFRHINRVSFAVYLLNPLIISFIYSLSKDSLNVNPPQMFVAICGFGLIVYMTAVPFTLLFEIPFCNWSSTIQKRKYKTA